MMEKLGSMMQALEKLDMAQMQNIINAVQLIMEIVPPFEVKILKLQKAKDTPPKEYIALCFERPQKKTPESDYLAKPQAKKPEA